MAGQTHEPPVQHLAAFLVEFGNDTTTAAEADGDGTLIGLLKLWRALLYLDGRGENMNVGQRLHNPRPRRCRPASRLWPRTRLPRCNTVPDISTAASDVLDGAYE